MANQAFDSNLKEKMNHERTPLLTTVRVAPRRRRSNVLERCCTIALASTLIVTFVCFILPLSLLPDYRHHYRRPHRAHRPGSGLTFEELQALLIETPSESKAEEWSWYYTSGPHLAGKNYSQVLWTQEKWEEFGVPSTVAAYDIYINYPLGHRLALYEKSKSDSDSASPLNEPVDSWKVKFEASLEEDVLEEDPTSSLPNRVPTFHGYSASGNVTAPFVYVNYGTYQDFEDLIAANVSLKGKIAIARYGGIFRGLKVKRAQELGMVGTILYTDPGDDGEVTEDNGYELYPNGPARHPTSVQRGSTQFLSIAPGDPTTPGYPSKPGVPRQDPHGSIPSIPSIPISYVDALPILKALNGHGPSAKDISKHWNDKLGLKYKGVEYNVGPSPDNLVLNLVNEQEYVTTPLWNVIGVINGTVPDEVIVIGNHRDAWIAGGAGDPNSGSAAINEVIRSFGLALSKGWKPLRTIVFASWDGEEYGLIGSTEWVEEYLPWLSHANVVYLNVDVATTGPTFHASANPVLNQLLYEITALVQSPNQTVPGQTVRDLWNGDIQTMGSGSDFTAFQDYAGVASLDMGFGPDPAAPGKADRNTAVYQYHSNYDSFYWMSHFGDPGFRYHATAARIWALMTAKLADSPVIPLNATEYAKAMKEYIKQVESKVDNAISGVMTEEEELEARARPYVAKSEVDLTKLKHSLKKLYVATRHFYHSAVKHDALAASLAEEAGVNLPWWKWLSKLRLIWRIRKVNTKYKYLDRHFLHKEGLDSRPWFKHVVFAPGIWTGYAGAVVPGIVEAVDRGDFEAAQRWVGIVEEKINAAAESLN
ncbi:hypothetical protein F5884DRAFT_320104 [Xylogone sp. PMI_703]|nr:hypothetical protein F5884DRAFT_320104 [Xylogone sp. PMI_703]